MELEPNLGGELDISAKLALATPKTGLSRFHLRCFYLEIMDWLRNLSFPKTMELLHAAFGACTVFCWSKRRQSRLELFVGPQGNSVQQRSHTNSMLGQ
jgi:hypothetical protein